MTLLHLNFEGNLIYTLNYAIKYNIYFCKTYKINIIILCILLHNLIMLTIFSTVFFFFGHFTAVTGPYAGEHKTNLAVSTEFNAM